MYDPFDFYRLRMASVLAAGGISTPERIKKADEYGSIAPGDMEALGLFAAYLCSEGGADYELMARDPALSVCSEGGSFETSEAGERAMLSYTFTGSFWKELFRAEDHGTIDAACRFVSETSVRLCISKGKEPSAVLSRFHEFYSVLAKKKEDFLSRRFDEIQFIAMDLGLCPWDVLEREDIDRYASEGRDTARVQNDITERKLLRELEELEKALGKLPGTVTGPGHDRDNLVAVLLFDALRTARCPEADKANVFLSLSKKCHLGEITDEESWYRFRDNRTQFAADSFLMIHDVTDEDRFWKDMVKTERENDILLPVSAEVLRAVHGLLKAFEAYTLSKDHYLPSGFSAEEYSDRLMERLTEAVLNKNL